MASKDPYHPFSLRGDAEGAILYSGLNFSAYNVQKVGSYFSDRVACSIFLYNLAIKKEHVSLCMIEANIHYSALFFQWPICASVLFN